MAREQARGPDAARDEVRGAPEHLGEFEQQRVVRFAPVDGSRSDSNRVAVPSAPSSATIAATDLRQELLAFRAHHRRKLAIARRSRELDEAPRDRLGIDDARLLQVVGEPVGVGRGLWIHEPGGELRPSLRARGCISKSALKASCTAARCDSIRSASSSQPGAVHRLGDDRAVRLIAGQRLRLLVVVVLEAVLEAAKEFVGIAQRRRARRFDEAARRRAPSSASASRRHAQARIAPAAHHLQELHRELDLADAARCPP